MNSRTSKMFKTFENKFNQWHRDVKLRRKTKLTTIRHDMERVVKEELDFTKQLLKDISPIKIEVDKEFIEKFPIKITVNKSMRVENQVDDDDDVDSETSTEEDSLAETLD